jgi:hypothetical protein
VVPSHFQYQHIRFVIVDTPGFDDTNTTETDVFRKITTWLSVSYRSGRRIAAILYLHRIIDVRMQGSVLRNLVSLQMLCGAEFYKNIVLCTTFWEEALRAPNGMQLAERRESELRMTREFWGCMIDKGSTMFRVPEGPQAQQMARLFLWQLAQKETAILRLQNEIVERGISFERITESQASGNSLEKLRANNESERREVVQTFDLDAEAPDQPYGNAIQAELDKYKSLMEAQTENQRRRQAIYEQQQSEYGEGIERERVRLAQLVDNRARTEFGCYNYSRWQRKQRNFQNASACIQLIHQGVMAGKVICKLNPLMIEAYNLICDNCFINIAVEEYYSQSLLFPK